MVLLILFVANLVKVNIADIYGHAHQIDRHTGDTICFLGVDVCGCNNGFIPESKRVEGIFLTSAERLPVLQYFKSLDLVNPLSCSWWGNAELVKH